MISELKRIKYTCDVCKKEVVEERPEDEVQVLPDDWGKVDKSTWPHRGVRFDETRHYCDQYGCLYDANKWADAPVALRCE